MTRQTDEKSLYEQQEDRILAQSDAFISLLTKRGILGDHEIDNEKIRTAQQKRTQTSYHNTKMLLQHYRTIALHWVGTISSCCLKRSRDISWLVYSVIRHLWHFPWVPQKQRHQFSEAGAVWLDLSSYCSL